MDRTELESPIHRVIGCMIAVHKELGPGLLEQLYRRALEVEFVEQGVVFETEREVSLSYNGKSIGIHRLDLFVENVLVVELKAVETIQKRHYAQVRSYLKAVRRPIGLLANSSDFQLDARRVESNDSQ